MQAYTNDNNPAGLRDDPEDSPLYMIHCLMDLLERDKRLAEACKAADVELDHGIKVWRTDEENGTADASVAFGFNLEFDDSESTSDVQGIIADRLVHLALELVKLGARVDADLVRELLAAAAG